MIVNRTARPQSRSWCDLPQQQADEEVCEMLSQHPCLVSLSSLHIHELRTNPLPRSTV